MSVHQRMRKLTDPEQTCASDRDLLSCLHGMKNQHCYSQSRHSKTWQYLYEQSAQHHEEQKSFVMRSHRRSRAEEDQTCRTRYKVDFEGDIRCQGHSLQFVGLADG